MFCDGEEDEEEEEAEAKEEEEVPIKARNLSVASVLEEGPEEEEEGADLPLLVFLLVSSSFFFRQKTTAVGIVVEVVALADFDAALCTTLTLPPQPNHPRPSPAPLPPAAHTAHIRRVAARKSSCRPGVGCRRRRGTVEAEAVAAGGSVVDGMMR